LRKYGERTRPGWNAAGRIFLLAATVAIVAAFYDSYVLLQISVYIAILGFVTPWIHRRFVLKDQSSNL
jgi:multisubunit Na+/H+ antiporter MnhF subunit